MCHSRVVSGLDFYWLLVQILGVARFLLPVDVDQVLPLGALLPIQGDQSAIKT
jgi:hypothetical protein